MLQRDRIHDRGNKRVCFSKKKIAPLVVCSAPSLSYQLLFPLKKSIENKTKTKTFIEHVVLIRI